MKRFLALLLVGVTLLSLLSSCGEVGTETQEKITATQETVGSIITAEELYEKEVFSYDPIGVPISEREFPDLDLGGMTEAQKALVTTAESYLIRGTRAQYEDTLILATSNLLHYRWAVNQRSPEEYTSQNLGFLQCAAFCYEVYRNALDLPLIYEGKTCYYTSRFESYANKVLHERPVDSGFSKLSKEELEAKKQTFLNTLQVGDIIVYRTKNNGHAMLYVGSGKVIHSSGYLYDWENKKEGYDLNGTVRMDDVSFLFDEGTGRYIFNKQSYFIVRPLNDFSVQIPEKSKSRINAMRGILAEKLSSHPFGKTVNPGEEITFTFSLENKTRIAKNLRISDSVPEFTEYVSGDFLLSGNLLSADISLKEGETKEFSYTVRVKKDTPLGTSIQSESLVDAIPTVCPEIRVAKTLTPAEQKAIYDSVDALYASDKQGVELLNEIYEKALGKSAFDAASFNDVMEDLFRSYSDVTENGGKDAQWSKAWRALDKDSAFLPYLVTDLYGGRYVPEGTSSAALSNLEWFEDSRIRYLSTQQLVPGDVIIVASNTQNFMSSALLFTGDALLSLSNNSRISPEPRLSQIIAEKAFVVLRPSMAL